MKYLVLQMSQVELLLRDTSPRPVADFFKTLYDNIFNLLEETHICKVRNEKVN